MVQQPPSIESLFQGAAKGARGVLERGEKLGINQAVREAMGEIRKNMQGFNETKFTPQAAKDLLSHESAAKGLVAMERRNRQLASMLDETVANLKTLSASNLEDRAKSLDLIEIAAAKVQFVQIYLDDSTMDIQGPTSADSADAAKDSGKDEKAGAKGMDAEPKLHMDGLSIKDDKAITQSSSKTDEQPTSSTAPDPDKMDITPAENKAKSPPPKSHAKLMPNQTRPLPVPTRSTLAQSSFSWMLEPDDSKSSRPSSSSAVAASSKSPPPQHPHAQPPKKRSSNNASREKNAFLFGEVTSESGKAAEPLTTEEIFGMEPLPEGKKR
jgi:TBC1 domain family protein 5